MIDVFSRNGRIRTTKRAIFSSSPALKENCDFLSARLNLSEISPRGCARLTRWHWLTNARSTRWSSGNEGGGSVQGSVTDFSLKALRHQPVAAVDPAAENL